MKLHDIEPLENVHNFFNNLCIKKDKGSFRQKIKWLHYQLKFLVSSIIKLPIIIKSKSFLILSDSSENREFTNGKTLNKLFYQLENILSEDILLFEKNVNYTSNQTNRTLSSSILYVSALILSKTPNFNKQTRNKFYEPLLTKNKQLQKKIMLTYSSYLIFSIILKRWGKKAIFLSDYYNPFHLGAILAAKEKRITTIEFQHGIINAKHFAYNLINTNSSLTPDYLFYYSLDSEHLNSNTFYINKSNTYNIGHPYLSFIIKNRTNKAKLKYSNNKNVCLVTLQWIDQEVLIPVILKLSNLAKNYHFILLPRNSAEDLSQHDIASYENISIEREINFYQLLDITSIHLTSFSTCALEATAFQIPNLMFNKNNKAKSYFSNFFKDQPEFNQYFNTPEEAAEILLKMTKNNTPIFNLDHKTLLKKALSSISL